MEEIALKVDSAYPSDLGFGKARIDQTTMQYLSISPGDLIKITGKENETVAKVWRLRPNDWDQQKLRIDGFTRTNANLSIGDTVRISPLEKTIVATQITLALPEEIPEQFISPFLETAKHHLTDFPVSLDDVIPIPFSAPFFQIQHIQVRTIGLVPEDAHIIGKNTEIILSERALEFGNYSQVTYEDIGGLRKEVQKLRETIELPLRHPEIFAALGIESPKGVLLYGPPGTGKTLIAKAVANESGAHFIPIAGPEIISKYYGESEQRLREIFEEAEENAPTIIFIDELDSIAPKREEVTGEVERRVVAQLLTMMDGLLERGNVIVIGATNRVDSIDPALRRPGRFDREIEIGVPTEEDRKEILEIHTRNMPLAEGVNITSLAQQTHGYTGADIAALAREGAITALRRYLPEMNLEEERISDEVLSQMEVHNTDFTIALRQISPSGMREVMPESSHIRWNDVGGLADAIEEIREAVEYPLTRRDMFLELGINPPRGVLLYGPPGTGKTLIAKAVANESGANFIAVRGPQLLSKWVGESERAVREIFKRARQVAPSVLFFDELDALTPVRGAGENKTMESVLNQFLTEMDGMVDMREVVILGASNRPDLVDPALIRAGRFDRLIFIGEPNLVARKRILDIHSQNMPIEGGSLEKYLEQMSALNEEGIEGFVKVLGSDRAIDQKEMESIIAAHLPKTRKTKKTEDDVPPLSTRQRRDIFVKALAKNNLILSDPVREQILTAIASDAEGYVGADLETICREAGLLAMREKKSQVGLNEFMLARKKVHPTMNVQLRDFYGKIQKHFKSGIAPEAQLPEYQ
ncbi:MAG: CDC48 family AAA ATPase [Methanomicrobiales archaeon]|nr:CDC48 family AAA ATPase [Methanomicrobiales archaeon]